MFEDPVEAAVFVNQLGRCLLPHTWHAWQVVALVATQRGVLHIQIGGHTRSLLDARLVVERIVTDTAFVVEHLHIWVAHQLVAIAVAGDDDHRITAAHQLVGGRCDEVVGLPTDAVERSDPDRVEHLSDKTHLLAENVGGRLALSLVQRFRLVSERRLGPVERDKNPVGLMIFQHVDQH